MFALKLMVVRSLQRSFSVWALPMREGFTSQGLALAEPIPRIILVLVPHLLQVLEYIYWVSQISLPWENPEIELCGFWGGEVWQQCVLVK